MPQTATSGNCLAAGLNNALEVVAFDEANKAMVCDDFFVEPITAGGMASAWLQFTRTSCSSYISITRLFHSSLFI